MVEYYSSPEYLAKLEASRPKLRDLARGTWAMLHVLYYARPFVKQVFIEPMSVVDPSGRRLREAFKRIQLLGQKPDVAKRPFARFMQGVQSAYNTRPGRMIFGNVLSRVAGVPEEVLVNLYSEDERQWAMTASYDSLAEDALAAKYVS
jgi:hypothetical protein